MPIPSKTKHKSDDTPIPAKKTIHEGEVRTTAHKTYTNFIHKVFDYLLIPLFNYI